jgi:hypothetical protein
MVKPQHGVRVDSNKTEGHFYKYDKSQRMLAIDLPSDSSKSGCTGCIDSCGALDTFSYLTLKGKNLIFGSVEKEIQKENICSWSKQESVGQN